MSVVAIAFMIAGCWQLDQRRLLATLTSVDANRRLLVTGVSWLGAVLLVS